MRLATVVLLGCIGGWSLGTRARAVELEEGVPSVGAPVPDDPTNRRRPSGRTTSRPFALLVPSLA